MDRRQLLLGTAGIGVAFAIDPVSARPASAPDGDGFPMPSPQRGLAAQLPETDPSRTLMELGWRFHEGDIAVPEPQGHHETYMSVKAGNALGAAAPIYDDSDWQDVRLPHDWAAAQPFVQSANVSQGYRTRGIG